MKIVKDTLLSESINYFGVYWLIGRNKCLRHLLSPIEDALY